MKNYTGFSVEDFVQEPYFRRWALGQLPSHDTFWETWQQTHPDQTETIEQARTLILALKIEDGPLSKHEVHESIEHILLATDTAKTVRLYRPGFIWAIAACLALVLVGTWSWYQMAITTTANGDVVADATQQVNQSTQPMIVLLPDGSRVTLEPSSQLLIGKAFGKSRREVFLTGEAFFEVTRNATKPFMVYTGKMVTKVLGTSFRIKAYATDSSMMVAVRTGRVTVFRQGGHPDKSPSLAEQVILLPNQQAVFVKAENRLVKTLVSKPVVLLKKEQAPSFNFSETAIPEVFAALENAYGIRIIFDNELLAECNLTASLENITLFEQLDLICETIQAHYEVVDGQVIVYGKGCH